MSIRAIINLFETTERKVYTRKPTSSMPRWIGIAQLMAVAAVLYFAVTGYLDRTTVIYDLDDTGKSVCTQVETKKGVMSCESFTKKELDSFHWENPAPSSRH